MESQIRGRYVLQARVHKWEKIEQSNYFSVLTEIIQANDYAFSLFLCDLFKACN